jgi:PAS domain S-box-containing protein
MVTKTGSRSTPRRSTTFARTIGVAAGMADLSTFLDAVSLPVSLIDQRYIYTWVNNRFAEGHGKGPQEIIGRTVPSLWSEETFNSAIKGMLDRCFEGAEVRDKAWMRFPALGLRYCEAVYSPYRPDGETAVSAIVITYDITHLKEMEERLSQSEQRFRDLSEASLEAIVFMEDGVIVDANRALSQLFGYEDEEPRGRLATDFIAPDRRRFTGERIKTRTEGVYETMGIRKDGSLFPIEVNPKELEVRGRTLRVSAVRDLTERKRIEAELNAYREHLERLVEERTKELTRSEEKFRSIFENATEGIFQIAPDGRILTVNPAFARIHGYDSPEELIAKVTNIEQIHTEPERRRAYMAQLHKEGRVRNFEFKVYDVSGAITWVSVNARTVLDETGAVFYHEGTVQDISQRKQAEEYMLVQRNLALKLAATSSLDEALSLCLEKAMQASGMDCGSVHLRNPDTDDLELAVHRGLSEAFIATSLLYKAHSKIWSLVTQRRQVAFAEAKDVNKAIGPFLVKEGMRTVIMAPVSYKGQVIASMNLGSRQGNPGDAARPIIDLIANQLGAIFVRFRAEQALEEDIKKRKEAEEALEMKSRSLEEANAALKVLLKQREEDRNELEERLVSNVKQLVLPHVEKLKKSRLESSLATAVEFVDANLKEILSPFLNNLRSFNFSPRQLEIIALIKQGRTTKDIAEFLHVSKDTIDKQRFLIRKKLDINKEKTNLRSFLLSLS